MSDPQPKPRPTRAQEEAAEWLARLGNHSISTQTVREFRDWRDDPVNDAAYEEAEAFWDASGRHAADPEILRMTQDALDRGKRRSGWRAWLRGPRLAGGLTLAGLAAAGGTILAVQQLEPAYATDAVEQKVVRLEDGSRVHLNVDSKVKVAFRDGERRLVLAKGEAFFDVAHDAARPFVVEADGARIRALGTKFDVRRQDGGVRVTLLQGAVQVSPEAGQGAVVLAPNQEALVSAKGAIRKVATDAARTTSWTTGRLVFRETPLAAAVAEVNRYSDRKVELAGPGLAERPVSGFFDVGDSESFARGVAELFDLSLSRGQGGSWKLAPGAAATSGPQAGPGA
ncbi:FecR family protein [Phenylobacterium kunshanense]|uniref:Iron dicitrate transport regulator FecR n=1 Tax=Phenylobacterium kunshanense TaxID=1445034 RepID=A0A328BIA2_9CAUL|nr:FecR family protein [Phenylobacterium kunshanense]RAK66385.1 iron dicitrate transport regulator FecR [Phenylobacterium kunshanense]